jgi:hypothetical protein
MPSWPIQKIVCYTVSPTLTYKQDADTIFAPVATILFLENGKTFAEAEILYAANLI